MGLTGPYGKLSFMGSNYNFNDSVGSVGGLRRVGLANEFSTFRPLELKFYY